MEVLSESVLFLASISGKRFIDLLLDNIVDSKILIKMPSIFNIDFFNVTNHVVTMWFIALILIIIIFIVVKNIEKDKSFIGGKFSLLIESFIEFIDKEMIKPYFINNSKKWIPFFLTLFFYIMLCNLFGLLPGIASITSNLGVTLSLSLIVFLLTHVNGMFNKGIIGYWLNIVPSGIPKVLIPLMFIIEFVGLLSKPFSLTIRLFANMVAGNIIILILLFLGAQLAGQWHQIGIAPLTVMASVMVTMLKIFVSILQAYVFTLLSAIFISAAAEKH